MAGFLMLAMVFEWTYVANRAAAVRRHEVLHQLIGDDWSWHERVINAVYPF